MIWLKRIMITLTSVVCLFLLLFWLAVSRLGSPTLLSFAVSYVPSLTVGKISGGLSSTLIVESLKYQTDTLAVNLERADLTLRWRCLTQIAVCADALNLDGLNVLLLPSTSEQPKAKSVDEIITLPLLLVIDSLNATNSSLRLADDTQITLDTLNTELRFYRRLRLLTPKLAGLSIASPQIQASHSETEDNSFLMARQDIQMADIFIPINAEIAQLQLSGAKFSHNGTRHALDSLFFDSQIKGHQIEINDMSAAHSSGTLQANLSATLSDSFPLDANLRLAAELDGMPAIAANLILSGSLDDLQLDLQSESPLTSSLSAKLQPLSAQLPIQLSFNWQPFSQTQLAPFGLPNMSVEKGSILLDGNINDYALTVDSELSVPQLPTPITLDLKSLANLNRIDISDFEIGLLNGVIQSSGNISFTDTLHWQMSTEVIDLNAQAIDPRLPTQIKGTLTYQGQIENSQPNLNIQTIDISATQQEFPLSIKGYGAYAGNAGVAVSNLRIAHKQNSFQGFARLLVDRRIDADVIVAIEALGESVPGYEGQLRGNIMLMGEPTAPHIEVALEASDIASRDGAGNRLSVADTASLRINGTSTKQSVTLDYVHAALNASLESNLELIDSRWVANIGKTSINNNAVSAVLAPNVAIIYDPLTSSLSATDVCWQINVQGEACIVELDVTSERSDVTVKLEDITIDEWLKLYSPAIPLSSADAKLSALLNGRYSKDSGLVGTVEGEITDSAWNIGDIEKNTMVSIEPAHFSLSANQNVINADMLITSPTLGNIQITSTLDTAPDKQSVQAEVIANNILLAPFAHLSEDIHQLGGVFDANLVIQGGPDKPQLVGALQLKDGLVDIARAPSTITDWDASLTFDRFNAEYQSAFKLGGGAGQLNGNIDWREDIRVNADVKGEQLNVSYQDIDVSFSPDIKVAYQQQKIIANGSVSVPKAKVALQALPKNAITPSSDVHLRGEPAPTSILDLAEVDLQILIDPERLAQVELDAFGLTADLAGQMRLTTQPSIMGFGDLQIVNGQYSAYGQELLIRTGEIQFNGPLSQPLLFIEAIRDPQLTENDVVAGILIDGLATEPNLQLFSEPSLNQSENLTYLLTGRGKIGGSGVDESAFEGLLIGLGVSNSGRLTGAMGEALGIDDLQLSSKGSRENTQVSVSGTIAPNLTLEYGVGLSDSVPEVTLRYKLLPKLFVEATSGLEQSLMVYYEFAVGEIKQGLASTAKPTE